MEIAIEIFRVIAQQQGLNLYEYTIRNKPSGELPKGLLILAYDQYGAAYKADLYIGDTDWEITHTND